MLRCSLDLSGYSLHFLQISSSCHDEISFWAVPSTLIGDQMLFFLLKKVFTSAKSRLSVLLECKQKNSGKIMIFDYTGFFCNHKNHDSFYIYLYYYMRFALCSNNN